MVKHRHPENESLKLLLLADFHCAGNRRKLPMEAAARRLIFQKSNMRHGNEIVETLEDILSKNANTAEHVLIAGDLTDSGAEEEYEAVAGVLSKYDKEYISVVPGNHDVAGFHPFIGKEKHRQRFMKYFGKYMNAQPSGAGQSGYFPYIKVLKEKFVVIGLDSTVLARPVYSLEGGLGKRQNSSIKNIFETGEHAGRHLIFLLHHDPVDSRFRPFLPTELADAGEFKKILFGALKNRAAKSITVVYGHSHEWKTSRHGGVDFICVPGLAFYKCDPCHATIEVGGQAT